MRVAPEIVLTSEERDDLTRLAQSRLTSARLVLRARIVLLAAKGLRNKDIATELDVGHVQVSRWRERYLKSRFAGIERDLPRGAPSAAVDVARLVQLTTRSKPRTSDQWSTRTLAAALGISPASVSRHWRAKGLTPQAVCGIEFGRDPDQAGRIEDIVGLYLAHSARTLVFSCDEGNAVKASVRSTSGERVAKGRLAGGWLSHLRHSDTTLFGALDLLEHRLGATQPEKRRGSGWLKFLGRIEREMPKDRTLHVLTDNHAANKLPVVRKWLAAHRRFHLHPTPAPASWRDTVEGFFSGIDDKRLRPGVFASAPKLIAAIEEYVEPTGADAPYFIWTASVATGTDGRMAPPGAGRALATAARGPGSRLSPAGDSLREHVIRLKRDRILQEAAKLFFERGYLTTSVDAIAERLGASKPFVYYHFNSKVDILIEICERSIRDVLAAAESATSAEDSPSVRLERFLREFTTISLEQHQMVAIYFREEINLPKEASIRLNQMRKSIDRRLSALLSEGIKAGEFQIEDPRMGALVIAGMSSYAFAWYREGGRLDREELTDRIVKMALKLVSAPPYHRPSYRVHSLAGT